MVYGSNNIPYSVTSNFHATRNRQHYKCEDSENLLRRAEIVYGLSWKKKEERKQNPVYDFALLVIAKTQKTFPIDYS